MRWEDIGSDEIRIVSAPGARTKSGKWRVIPITSGAEEALGALRQRREFVLPQISPFSVTRAFHRTLNRAELDGGVHCLRHSFCSHLVQAGFPCVPCRSWRAIRLSALPSSMPTCRRPLCVTPSPHCPCDMA